MIYILFNPMADNKRGKANAEKALEALNAPEQDKKRVRYIDITTLNAADFVRELPAEDTFILTGGDGTLNHFANECAGDVPAHDIYYFPCGSGNDFMKDIDETERRENPEAENSKKDKETEIKKLILLNDYLKDLPVVTVNGKSSYFINGIGYGIDGYCCEEGDKLRAQSEKKINYTNIAIKGLLKDFKSRTATVTVDGVTRHFRNVWLAPTMNGRFYGGGMMIAPDQDRLNEERLVSVVVLHNKSKLKTLIAFPGIFKGEHVKRTEMVKIITGHEVKISFEEPTALQIDGETVTGVTEYQVKAGK